MKKTIVAATALLFSLAAMAGDAGVNEKVLNAFKKDFSSATQVEWTTGSGFYKAVFLYNEKYVYAFYSEEGRLLGLTRNITVSELPLKLQTCLKKNYDQYWISDLFEAAREEGTFWYITLEDADTRLVLKATAEQPWTVYEKQKKS